MPELKYLFVAEYVDGARYEQGTADVSMQDPARNAFFDVHYRPWKPEDELVRFSLISHCVSSMARPMEGHSYCVDLRDGHFEVDGVAFRMWEGQITASRLRLVFWKRHTHTFRGGAEIHEIVYRIGWQGMIDGENVQRVLEID